MATVVGGVGCSFVRGVASGLRQRVMTWATPGINGQAALLLGFNEGAFSFTAVLYDSLANVLAWKLALEALQGSTITITDDWGTNWPSLLVTNVSELRRAPALGSGVAGVTTRGEIAVKGTVVA